MVDKKSTLAKTPPPLDEAQLLQRAQDIAGLSLGETASNYAIKIPDNLNKEKGWVGLLLEHVLGASAGSRPEPDFPHLGIELKTLPINRQGKPLETTFVCVAPLKNLIGATWQNSHIRNKIARVLWVPIIAEREIPLAERLIGTPFIWSPSLTEENAMALDWQELTDMIVLGQVEQINGKHGQVLQLRPKAANSQAKTQAIDKNGKPFLTLPRGFYLKTSFTHQILKDHLRLD
ncbi:MAG: DNA mismatch repair endonuclease MutH [Gammaproteobacteria bacterium]|nr:MAG: DNA mismatch repair endonuclease MutH [Gammaproteobacteria bacterium]